MTLIIAGYEYTESLDYSSFTKAPPQPTAMELAGLFVVADSAITSHGGGRTLLNGFRKVYELEAKLWQPFFMPDGSFNGYQEVYKSHSLVVAFAGSTLTAQHILNSITEHLKKIRISYTREGGTGAISYTAIRHCEKNPLDTNEISYWDDNTFSSTDFTGLLSGSVIHEIIEYSINEALRSAAKYKLDMAEFMAMHTELLAGLWCPSTRQYQLYVYRMLSRTGDDGVLTAYTQGALVPQKEVVVLGLRSQFESQAQTEYDRAIASLSSPSTSMQNFLNSAINQVQSTSSREIDRPILATILNEYEITIRKHV